MGLLYRSVFRHLKQHAVQTGLTMAVAILFIGLLAVIIFFAAGFGTMLRENAIETVGSYHFCYCTPVEADSRVILERMEEALREDEWFSEVILVEEEGKLCLFLTVKSPGIFTSIKMDKILDRFVEQYHAERKSVLIMGHAHNLDLLASYGDLNRENGLYSFLLVFFMAFFMIAGISVLTLTGVFGVSASQREKEFALLASIGADSRQIKGIVLLESAFYIGLGIPGGLLWGNALFWMGKAQFDTLCNALGYPSVRWVLSLPFCIVLVVSAAGIILLSGMLPARKASVVSPMRLLAGEEMFISEESSQIGKRRLVKKRHPAGKSGGRNFYGGGKAVLFWEAWVEAWLAYKSHRRFHRRFRPIFLVLSATFALCFVVSGVGQFSFQAMEMTKEGLDYNISVELYGDSLEKVDALAREIIISTEYELEAIRTARFELQPPWPLSEEAEASGFPGGGALPDILLVGADEALWEELCAKNAVDLDAVKGTQGIFVNENRRWSDSEGSIYQGKPFEIKKGDEISVYSSRNEEADGQAVVEIQIMGVAEDVPLYLKTEPASRMVVVVEEEVFLQMEALRSDRELGIHHVFLRGICEDAYRTERISRECIDGQKEVTGITVNCDEGLKREKASADGFQYLGGAFVVLLSVAAVCGNFTVSWSVDKARKREFTVLSSIGMRPEEIRKMRYWELLFQTAVAVLTGFPAGILCYYGVFKVYTMEYAINWQFPWQGLGMGIILLTMQVLITEIALRVSITEKRGNIFATENQ